MSTSTRKDFLFKVTGLLAFTTLISRLLGFIREMLFASLFGASTASSTYKSAYNLSDFVRTLLITGALSAIFIPVFVEYKKKVSEQEVKRIALSVFNFILTLSTLLTVLGIIFSPLLVKIFYYGYHGDTYTLTVSLNRILFPIVILLALSGLVMGILQSYDHFTLPAVAPIFVNIIVIIGTFTAAKWWGVHGYAYSVIAADLFQLAIQIPALWALGFRPSLALDLKHPAIRQMAKIAPTAILSFSVYYVNSIVDGIITSPIEMRKEGCFAALKYAFMVQQLPFSVFGISIATALFPTLSTQVVEKRIEELKNTLSEALRMIFLTIMPFAAMFIFMSAPMLEIIFQHGAFDAHDTALTAPPLAAYGYGLFAGASVQVILRVFFSFKDYLTPTKIGIAMITLNVILDILLARLYDHTGIAMATSIVAVINVTILLFFLQKKLGGIGIKKIFISFVKITVLSLIQGIVSFSSYKFLVGQNLDNLWGHSFLVKHGLLNMPAVFTSLALGLIVFIVLAIIIRLEELANLTKLLKKLLMR